jgi:hypothetical protein
MTSVPAEHRERRISVAGWGLLILFMLVSFWPTYLLKDTAPGVRAVDVLIAGDPHIELWVEVLLRQMVLVVPVVCGAVATERWAGVPHWGLQLRRIAVNLAFFGGFLLLFTTLLTLGSESPAAWLLTEVHFALPVFPSLGCLAAVCACLIMRRTRSSGIAVTVTIGYLMGAAAALLANMWATHALGR